MVDLTIGYPDRKQMDMQTIIGGWRKSCETVIYYRKYKIEDVPNDTEGLTSWMYSRFEEKEHMLETFYSTGAFPVPPPEKQRDSRFRNKPELIAFETWWLLSVQAFYFSLTVVQYWSLYMGYTWLLGLIV